MSVVRIVRLRVPAGQAKPGPAIGQALGPLGINMMEFCKAFNAATETLTPSTPIPVRLTAFSNRTFTFETRTPPSSWFLKRCAGVAKGSPRPGHSVAGSVTLKQLYEIAQAKAQDEHVKHLPIEGICRSLAGSCISMGLQVVDDRESVKPLEVKEESAPENEESEAA
mmetsp:Transcript_25754/g.57741  ORF Transcript_25754/g.57741 Transcript_25754/m.57741 type:complete len:167 (+) Transcript_25754:104-604(+)